MDTQPPLSLSNTSASPQLSRSVKGAAAFFSYLFHPVFIPLLVFYFMLYWHPYLFIGLSEKHKILILVRAAVLFTFFPVITVLLLRAVGFIDSVQLRKQKDRIIPLIANGIWYFWAWNVWHNLEEYPHEAIVFAMAAFLSSSMGLLANIYFKISLHAIAMGVMLGFIAWMAFVQPVSSGAFMAIAVGITGIVCTARLVVSDHTPAQVYLGLAVGIAALTIATVVA